MRRPTVRRNQMSNRIDASQSRVGYTLGPEKGLLFMPAAGDVIYAVDEGVVAVELPQLAGRRRIVDFLYRGDVISSRAMLGCNEVRLRAVEAASVVRHGRAAWIEGGHSEEPLLKLEQGVRRAQLAGLMTGLVDLDQRLASFLLSYCRRRQTADAGPVVEIAIAREELARMPTIAPGPTL